MAHTTSKRIALLFTPDSEISLVRNTNWNTSPMTESFVLTVWSMNLDKSNETQVFDDEQEALHQFNTVAQQELNS